MKVLAVVTVIFTAFAVSTLAQAADAFVPTDCGAQVNKDAISEELPLAEDSRDITQVCIGFKMSNEFDPGFTAVSFRMSDMSEKIFEVVQTAHLFVALRDGAKKSTYFLKSRDGEEAAMTVTRSASGELMNVSGKLDGTAYRVMEFRRSPATPGF